MKLKRTFRIDGKIFCLCDVKFILQSSTFEQIYKVNTPTTLPLQLPSSKMSDLNGMVDPKIFEDLQTKIDEDAEVRDQLKAILQTLERQCRNAQSVLSRAHSTPASHCKSPKASCLRNRHLTFHSAACASLCRECYKGRS